MSQNLITQSSPAYSLLDSGDGQRLEKFGENTLIRLDNTCIWHPALPKKTWESAQGTYQKKENNKFSWDTRPALKTPWTVNFAEITLSLRLGPSKNIGVFPEQQTNWAWMAEKLKSHPNTKVLNLFGYTGGASLIAAKYQNKLVGPAPRKWPAF